MPKRNFRQSTKNKRAHCDAEQASKKSKCSDLCSEVQSLWKEWTDKLSAHLNKPWICNINLYIHEKIIVPEDSVAETTAKWDVKKQVARAEKVEINEVVINNYPFEHLKASLLHELAHCLDETAEGMKKRIIMVMDGKLE